MSYSEFNNLTTIYGIAYYKGYIYAGSYDNRTITKIKFTDKDISSVYYNSFTNEYKLGYFRIYDNYFYCSLINIVDPSFGKIIRFDLDSDGSIPDEYIINLNNPKSFTKDKEYIYITTSNSILRYNLNNLLISEELPITINNPSGIDTDGLNLYYCDNDKVYIYDYFNLNILTTLDTSENDNLIIYGKYIYVSNPSQKKIYKINKQDGNRLDYITFDDYEPNSILFVNNNIFLSSKNSNKILISNVCQLFNYNFSLNYDEVQNIFTYSLNNNFYINNNWNEIGFQSDKVIIDGLNKNITINNLNTETLFFGGSFFQNNRYVIKNLNIISNCNIKSGLIRSDGYIELSNCHLELIGNILDNGGGLVYNDTYDNIYPTIDISMINCSTLIKGIIGTGAGSLLGSFITGCDAYITDSFVILLDDREITNTTTPQTLEQISGVFVGSGVGKSNGFVIINNSYCIFSGGMSYGSSIIGGKFMGNNSNIILNKFYAITNIRGIVQPYSHNDLDTTHYPYLLSLYNGGNLFNDISATNVNFLNFGINNLNMYADNNTFYSDINGINKFTDFNSFDIEVNSENSKLGTLTYYLNKFTDESCIGYKCYTPDNNKKYNILIGDSSNNTILLNRNIDILQNKELILDLTVYGGRNYKISDYYDISLIPNGEIKYMSSNLNIATVDTYGIINIQNIGDVYNLDISEVTISAYVNCDSQYSYNKKDIISINPIKSFNVSIQNSIIKLLSESINIFAINNIIQIHFSNDAYIGQSLGIDYGIWLINYSEEQKRNIRKEQFNIILGVNYIENNTFITTTNSDRLGINNKNITIKVHKPNNPELNYLELTENDIYEYERYVALYKINDFVKLSINNLEIIVKKTGEDIFNIYSNNLEISIFINSGNSYVYEYNGIGIKFNFIGGVFINYTSQDYLAGLPILEEGQKLNLDKTKFDLSKIIDVNKQRKARHSILNMIFEMNDSITSFIANGKLFGLDDRDIKFYNAGSVLNSLGHYIKQMPIYVNIYNINDNFNIENLFLIKKIALDEYEIITNIDLNKKFYKDGEKLKYGKYLFYFGGVYVKYSSSYIPCLTHDTKILTPKGYITISKLKINDIIITSENREVNIKDIFTTCIKGTTKTYPYIIEKNSIGINCPIKTTYLSGGHLIKNNNLWIHPELSGKFKQDKTKDIITYYHIETPNYETDYLIINGGLIVESYTGDNSRFKNVRQDRIKKYINNLRDTKYSKLI